MALVEYSIVPVGDERQPAQQLDVSRSTLLLVVKGGELLEIRLRWRAEGAMQRNYTTSIQLLDDRGEKRAQQDNQPNIGLMATSSWRKGDEIDDRYLLPLPKDLEAGVYRLVIRPYWLVDMTQLTSPDGKSTDFVAAVVRRLPESPVRAEPSNLVGKTFGGAIKLVLYWTAVAPVARDLTVFNHVLDGAGKLRGQQDGQPMDGRFPTSIWLPGEVIRDEHIIALDPQTPPGTYRILTGLYDLASGDRLKTEDGSDSVTLVGSTVR